MPELQTEPEIVVGPEPLAPRVVAVAASGEAVLRVTFEDGEVRAFDVAPLLAHGVFQQVAAAEPFARVAVVEGGAGVEWPAGPDLSANRLYFGGKLVET